MTVYDVLEYLTSGMSKEDILKDFPDLTREDIRAYLAFAADRERKLSLENGVRNHFSNCGLGILPPMVPDTFIPLISFAVYRNRISNHQAEH